jgi:hypothetical protein
MNNQETMTPNEQYLYANMQELFYGLNVETTFEGMFKPINNHTSSIKEFFDTLRTQIESQIGGNLIIPLKTLKQYINDAVNKITPK